MIKFAFAVAAAGMALAPVSATMAVAAPQAQADIIQQLFDKATEIYSGKGYSETGWQQRGEMKQGAETSYTITLKGGTAYSVVGMCDTDCSNLDAYLTDSSGKLVDSDVEEDDFPIVAASASGTYTLRLVMKACSAAPCSFGAKSFKQ
jgi:hypothetical protein